jgi:hypothetical protein
MGNILKPSPVGIDRPIQQMQAYLYNALVAKWGLDDTKLTCYGRAYRNATQDGYTPEVYVGNNEYKEVYYDDRLSASSFFGVGEEIKNTAKSVTADVFIIFMVNLNNIKPGVNRNDEECHIDVQTLVTRLFYGFTFTGITTGIDHVFREYSGLRRSKGIKFTDTHPQHCFRLNFKLIYNPFLNC